MPEPDAKRPRASRPRVLMGAARRRQQRRDDTASSPASPAAVSSSADDGSEAESPALLDDAVSSARPQTAAAHPTWRRMLHDLVRPSRAQAVMALLLCVCAMVTVWQVRARSSDQLYSQMRRTELVAVLDQLNTSNGQLRREITTLQGTKRELESGATSSRAAEAQAKQRVAELQILAGTAPATGPGITITIADPQGKVTHELLLDAIEEMRDAGGEALDLNGVRVVASTWLGTGPQGLVVDSQVIKAPYVLTVIGDPQTLEEGARFRGGLVSQAQAPTVGAEVTIVRSEALTISSLHTPQNPQFARPA